MEKFAIDLDKVLDDLEFNEDCAEQKASVEHKNTNKDFDIIVSLDKHKDLQQISDRPKCISETDTISDNPSHSTEETLKGSTGVNIYYTQECTNDTKIIQKQSVPSYDVEDVPLAKYNDISHKLIPKQQNCSNSPKIDNRYDKKWNQFNLKPSVSNVFSSLNDYINAPPGSSDCIYSVLDETTIKPDLETTAIYHASEIPHLTHSTVKDDKTKVLKEPGNITELVMDTSTLSQQDIILPMPVELFVTHDFNIKEDTANKFHVTTVKQVEAEPENIEDVTNAEASNYNTDDSIDQGNTVVPDCIHAQALCNVEKLATQLEDRNTELHLETTDSSDEQQVNLNVVPKVVGFGDIKDLSEDDLVKYLDELQEKEKLNEICEKGDTSSMLQESYNEDKEDEITQNIQSYTDNITQSSKIIETELSEIAENITVTDFNKEDTDKDPLNNVLEKQNEYQNDQDNENECSDILNDLSNTEAKLWPIVNEASNNTIKLETKSVPLENECVSNVKSSKDSQGYNAYDSNINRELLNECKTELEFAEQTENCIQHNQGSESKMQSNNHTILETKDSITLERKVFHDKAHDAKNVVLSSEEVSTVPDVSDINDDLERPLRPQTLDILLTNSTDAHQILCATSDTSPSHIQLDVDCAKEDQGSSPDMLETSLAESSSALGKQPPFWVLDSDAPSCMLCDVKFTVFKRRHHCRACGKVLCNKCCNMKYKLEYQGNIDSRVCVSCYQLLTKAETEQSMGGWSSEYSSCVNNSDINSPQGRQPNPNNPMEYCSTIPPLQQLAGGLPPPPTVMVPVGVLKREGGVKSRPEISKSVMFSDGIRPGCDLTELDMSWDLKPPYRKAGNKQTPTPGSSMPSTSTKKQNLPRLDPNTESYIPQDPAALPPTVTIHKGQVSYHVITDEDLLSKSLKNECEPPVMFAINRNLYAYVKILTLNCCINKTCWNVTSKGLACVGQDEVILLIEVLPDETRVPKDLLLFINQLYLEALKENTVSELGFSIFQGGNLLDSREHAGFLFIRRTLQCLQKIVLPPSPYLIGLLIHRWETPWAKVFPLRLVLRLGAEYRYYPCPLFSVRFRDALYFEIGHTVMKVLADFRNFAYTVPGVRGLTIHLSNRRTDVLFPKKRYDQVIKGLNNSDDHVLAYASNFSIAADSHLVCIQTNTGDESSYQTQAISMNNHPRTVTGTSFIVINGALKSSMGLSAKSSIVEDGLIVEIMPEKMEALKAALKKMQDFAIGCGRQGAPEPDETVNIKWVDNDADYNIGVKSPIDGQSMDGIPSMRVRNGTDYKGTSRFIRWTEVFIIHSDDRPNGVYDPVDISKLSGNIAKATCTALVKLLDLLANAGLTKLGVRTNIHSDNVGYEAGSEGMKLPPIYMNSLDNELIQVLHKAAQSSQDTHTVLELIFYILDD